MSTWTGALASFAALHAPTATELATWHDALAAITDPWTDFSGSVGWTASTPPVIGNGTITASYLQAGKLVIYQGRIAMGTTTTYGTGVWSVALPVALSGSPPFTGSAFFFDNSGATTRQAGICANNGTLLMTCYPGGTGGAISATVPYTWATSDVLNWTVFYQAP